MNKKKSNLPSECTTIIVGSQMSADGSRIVARSEDWDAMFAKNLTIHRPGEPGSVDPMPVSYTHLDEVAVGGQSGLVKLISPCPLGDS